MPKSHEKMAGLKVIRHNIIWSLMIMTSFGHLAVYILFSCVSFLVVIDGANWAQLAGERTQNTAPPYIPDQWHRSPSTSVRPMWSARWGHSVVVLNQPQARSYLTDEENSARLQGANPVLVLLGGDDGLPRDTLNSTYASEMGIGQGKLRNDVWISSSQSSWRVDDRYYNTNGDTFFNSELIRSEMRWYEANQGRIAPATWTSGPKYAQPLTNDEWIACQDSIKDRLDYTLALPDPSYCDEPPDYCYDDMDHAGCHEQGIWKRDNMWSPRRGHGAVVANDKLFVIGGEAREYARIDDSRLVGGLGNQHRIETVKDHSTIREELVLKNDVWVSSDDQGLSWELANPGCKDHPQEDVLLQTEVWSRDQSDSSLPKFVGSMGSKCYRSSDCYGVAECRALGNTPAKVCVCPMFSPRTGHAVVVQHRYSILEDESVFSQDVIYVIGGFINVKQAFCTNRSCGPSDGYRLAIDDAWMSSDNGVNWIQIKPAFGNKGSGGSFRGRGGHTALVIPSSLSSSSNNGTDQVEVKDRLLIFGGETASPQETSTSYLNDIWQIDLPTEPCCVPAKSCLDNTTLVYNETCLPSQDWSLVTSNAEWPVRSGHSTVYEPPSSSNAFQHRIYLSGGKNDNTVLSDVWTWDSEDDSGWQCDFCTDESRENTTSAYDVFLSIDSPLSEVKTFHLPPLDDNGELFNFTNHSVFPVISSDEDISIMASEGVNTIQDLASADLYKIVKLRGFDYPGRHAQEVSNICLLREISIALVEKCSIKETFFHRKRPLPSIDKPPSVDCGRGGETKPCVRGDWDGCEPIPGVSKVDVHGLGYVTVPQVLHNVSSIVEEIFCRQAPDGRYNGAAEFLDNKVVVLGGIGRHDSNNSTHLYRDVWARDESFPQAFITTKPLTRSPQSQFYFDSNEAGAIFEYKLVQEDGSDLTPWTTTTKNVGVNVDWLDDKKGGPGKGYYTLYVRSVDPSGNRDTFFSTQTNVYRWYYVPPTPWGAVSGFIIVCLVILAASYYEYRRRRRKRVMERFQLRRLRRKFKLKNANQEVHAKVFREGGDEDPSFRRRRRGGETNGSRSHSSSGHRSSRKRDASRSHSRSHRSRRREGSQINEGRPSSSHRHREHRSHSHSRSKSKSKSTSRDNERHPGLRERRRRMTPEEMALDEARARRRRDREKLRRNLREYR